MGRFLFAWELGGNFGHLSLQLPLARLLRQRGHEVLFAVKDVGIAQQMLTGDGFRYVQSPFPVGLKRPRSEPAGFADILAEAGFADPGILAGLVRAWQSLFEVYKPEAILAQYAPVAQLASRLAGLPCLRLGSGFECPPAMTPFPCFRPWLNLTRDDLLKAEELLLKNVNEVYARHGVPASDSLQRTQEAEATLLATLPEFDHYPGRRGGRYIGPIFIVDDGEELQWTQDESPRIFAYLSPFPELPTVLETLNQSGAHVIAVIPGISDELRAAYSSGRLRISPSRAKLSNLLPTMDLAINHANHGIVAASLLAGVPVLSIPITIEQWLLSRKVEQSGVSAGVLRHQVAAGFALALEKMLFEPVFRDKAKALAKKYSGYDRNRVLELLVNSIERLPQQLKKAQRPLRCAGC